jgi:hypothetical protein
MSRLFDVAMLIAYEWTMTAISFSIGQCHIPVYPAVCRVCFGVAEPNYRALI